MNFEQYREEFTARGGVETEAMRRFREADAECARWRQQALAFEARLRAALAVPAPDDLAASILARVSQEPATGQPDAAPTITTSAPSAGSSRHRQRPRWRLPAALAAAVVLAAVVGMLWRQPDLSRLERLAVEHVDGHRSALDAQGPVPLASLRQAFAGFGRLPHAVPAGLSFVSVCPLGDERTVHLVLRDEGGEPITGYFLREAPRSRPDDFRDDGMAGRYQPLPGGGALVLVAAHEDAGFDRAARAVESALSAAGGSTAAAR